ncbi:hypothetical protein CWB96_00040 [Pseudoalteromonas citrea]|uniref:Uncharacterized protein n=2 Tax=Pseudoalteromonas citrea TaxID=43655 RepID=A0A5S3XV99_9GAMM|nr:hypothetical protein CWB97_02470 [Pseudoalteromonas citrea]TMP63033.1 hypothetical protein CWB96_00040 [Pseudoalteromonas citrea]
MQHTLSNSDVFNITSSQWVEAFKEHQCFALNQAAHSKQAFQVTSQELLMSLYDNWFEWLLNTESMMGAVQNIDNKLLAVTSEQSRNLSHRIFDSYTASASYEPKLLKLWQPAYLLAHQAFTSYLPKIISQSPDVAFAMLSEQLLAFMQHCLLTLHEVDSLLYQPTQTAFISVDDFCCHIFDLQGEDLSIKRLKIYQSHSKVTDNSWSNWTIKQYSQAPNSVKIESNLQRQLTR